MNNNPFSFQYGAVQVPYVNVACMKFEEDLGLIKFSLIEEVKGEPALEKGQDEYHHVISTPIGKSILAGMIQEMVFRKCRRFCQQRRWLEIVSMLDDPEYEKWIKLEIAYAQRFGLPGMAKTFWNDMKMLKIIIDKKFTLEDDVSVFIACSWRACPERLEKLVKHLNQSLT